MMSPATPGTASVTSPPEDAEVSSAPKSYVPLILALNVVLVATISIVLYFVLKH
jgi:hypothetical protein